MKLTGEGRYRKRENIPNIPKMGGCSSITNYADTESTLNPTGGGATGSIVDYEELANLLNQDKGKAQTMRTARIMGMIDRNNQIKANIPNRDYSAYSLEKYKFFLEAPFEISNKCCNVMKKAPAHSFHKKMITAQMASESRLRTQVWLKQGCNAFEVKNPISNPMSFWTENDVLLYIRKNNLPMASIYGDIVTDDENTGQLNFDDICNMGLFELDNCPLSTTGVARSGCIFCLMGIHLEKRPNRLEMIEKVSNPSLLDYCLRGGDFNESGLWQPAKGGLGFWFILKWVNIKGGFNIYIPNCERYEERYGNDATKEYLYGE